jgi:hypothetical protein
MARTGAEKKKYHSTAPCSWKVYYFAASCFDDKICSIVSSVVAAINDHYKLIYFLIY